MAGPGAQLPRVAGRAPRLAKGRVSSTAAQAQQIRQREILLKAGYRVPDDAKAIGRAWKNLQAAHAQNIHPQRAAAYWNKNSGLAVPAKRATIDINGPHPGTGIATATPNKPLSSKPTYSVSPPPKAPAVKRGRARSAAGAGGQGPSIPPIPGLDPAAESQAASMGNAVPLSLGKTGRLGTGGADAIAGAQYDQSIADLQHQLALQPKQANQDQADITNWYAQVLASQKQAGAQDAAMTSAAVPSLSGADAAIIASLGGSANQGAPTVAASQANDVGTLQALGTNENQYNADIAPIYKMAQASAASSEQARQAQLALQLHQQLQDAMHSRGEAQAAALSQIQQFNLGQANQQGQNMVNIREYNNQLGQQGFANALALQNAQVAALLSGARAQYYAQGGNKVAAKSRQPKLGTFARMSPSAKQNLAGHILNTLPDPTQGLKLTPAQVRAQLIQGVRAAGIDPTAHMPWINNLYTTYMGHVPAQQ